MQYRSSQKEIISYLNVLHSVGGYTSDVKFEVPNGKLLCTLHYCILYTIIHYSLVYTWRVYLHITQEYWKGTTPSISA
jgi:hypothetical protein